MTNLDVATLGEAIGSFVADTTGNLADADVERFNRRMAGCETNVSAPSPRPVAPPPVGIVPCAAGERPEAPIVSLMPDAATARRPALIRGVHAPVSRETDAADAMVDHITTLVARVGLAAAPSDVVLLSRIRFGQGGGTDRLHIVRAGITAVACSGRFRFTMETPP